MEEEFNFYDGRDKVTAQDDNASKDDSTFQLTDEMRKMISGNPYVIK